MDFGEGMCDHNEKRNEFEYDDHVHSLNRLLFLFLLLPFLFDLIFLSVESLASSSRRKRNGVNVQSGIARFQKLFDLSELASLLRLSL